MSRNKDFTPFREKMEQVGLPDLSVRTFEKYFHQLTEGKTGMIRESDIQPVESLVHSDDLGTYYQQGCQHLKEAVIIKLNGGLGTSMGMQQAKSLVTVKKDCSFLDIIASQVLRLRHDFSATIPLMLMNSTNTQSDSLQALQKYSELKIEKIPIDFMQFRVPKIDRETFLPASYPSHPDLEWNPPGHGDIYNALVISDCLRLLLDHGYRYAFISNADNLGAELDPAILGYFAESQFSFMMEAATRTEADRKGGHLARFSDGTLLLREIAQCDQRDRESFQQIDKYRYFNTNTIWVNLEILNRILQDKDGFLNLPLICNAKTVNPRDAASRPVYQLETAMGAAISCFPDASAINVPRRRFLPVKTTNDLVGLWSDAYQLNTDWQIRLSTQRNKGVLTQLDPRYFKLINQLQERFPYGAPSLINCKSWTVKGDVKFGKNVSVEGTVIISNESDSQKTIPDNTVITTDLSL